MTVDVAGVQAQGAGALSGLLGGREVARLQISGSDLPADDPGPPNDRPVLLLNPRVAMSAGKAAEVGHATMLLAALLDTPDLTAWAMRDYRVRGAGR